MTNWRTNLGGALGTLGTALIGVGTLTQLTQLSPTTNVLTPGQLLAMWWVALAGFVISGVGKFFTALFAADAKQLATSHKEILTKIDKLESAVTTGDTSILERNPPPPPPDTVATPPKQP